ncbi:hypothetical protein AMAG_19835 [Allomyces macrogynus ATCC 38327]|uniref:Uncharacterized protein n=1 Tax=Allomyces macrogynus (strain ATCC 38327) TaxID=578462 RepID=A0A0L0SZW7_ALLM3|nr:hypothetical protein AMAG_19835 [Allomyces macrogynus ATCC 38327]|eukprot:KNE68037.1 hypothetical protein AMAG_19835 [Allomyces macrogynus ATCC 38327]
MYHGKLYNCRHLVRLDLRHNVVFPDLCTAREVFAALSRTLQVLKIDTFVRARSDESVLAALLDHVPGTVRFLGLALGPDKPLALIIGALAKMIACTVPWPDSPFIWRLRFLFIMGPGRVFIAPTRRHAGPEAVVHVIDETKC